MTPYQETLNNFSNVFGNAGTSVGNYMGGSDIGRTGGGNAAMNVPQMPTIQPISSGPTIQPWNPVSSGPTIQPISSGPTIQPVPKVPPPGRWSGGSFKTSEAITGEDIYNPTVDNEMLGKYGISYSPFEAPPQAAPQEKSGCAGIDNPARRLLCENAERTGDWTLVDGLVGEDLNYGVGTI